VLENTREDFNALARCYNAFKDSNSWPSGFGGSFTFTGEVLEKQMKDRDLTSHFIACDPEDKNKIIGVCFVGPMWNLPNGYYVLFLGVDPVYQKKGVGKALLLRATRYALEKKASIITLHTWGGNLKAMPLYKRQGYKWRPKTSVYMENYIPQILSYPLFLDFFRNLKSTWYSAFKPVITQEPNLEFDEKMGIYEYFFEENSQSLRVWVDRIIGKISGFHLKTIDKDLLIKAKTPKSEAFIGNENFPIILFLENKGEKQLDIAITFTATTQIELDESEKKHFIKLPSKSLQKISLNGKFLSNTEDIDLSLYSHTYSNHFVETSFHLDSVKFTLNVGKYPIHAIKALTTPMNFVTIPSHTIKIPISLQNYIGRKREVIVNIDSPFDSGVDFLARIRETSTTVDEFSVHLKELDGQEISVHSLPVIIFKESKVVSYELEKQIFIENKNVRVSLYKKPQPGDNEVFIVDKLRGLKIKGHPMILGYPFDDEGSEFYTLELEHQTYEDTIGTWLTSTAISQKNPGVKVIRRIFLSNDNSPISVSWKIINTSDRLKKNLGIQSASYWWPDEQSRGKRVIPLQEGIVHLDLHTLPIDMGNDPSEFTEGWQASEFAGGWIGCLFEPSQTYKFSIGRFHPKIDYKIPDLKPGESFSTEPVWFCFVDSWQQVRKLWQDFYKQTPINQLKIYPQSISHKKVGLIDGDRVYKCLLVDRKQKEVEVGFDAFRKTTPKGEIEISFNEAILNPERIELPETELRIWKEKITIFSSKSKRILTGTLKFDSLTRIFEFPLALGYYDSSKDIEIRKDTTFNYIEVDNGFLKYRGCEQFRGQVFYLSVEGSENYLLTFFPEVKPLLWFNEFYGGIGSILRPQHSWDMVEYNKLKFKSFEVQRSLWKGIGFRSDIINYSPKIRGLQVSTEYLTLPDAPFLFVRQEITNHSGVNRNFFTQIEGTLNTSQSNKDRYYINSNNKIATYQLQEWESAIWIEKDPYTKWAAYHKEGNKFMVVTVLPSTQQGESIGVYAPNLSIAYLNMNGDGMTIQPGETQMYSVLYLLTKKIEEIEPFTSSNLLETL
jgi:ribosomal protein S18 acetylase RimI-like enzyme